MKYRIRRIICCILLLVVVSIIITISSGLVVVPYSNVVFPLLVLFACIVTTYWISIL